MIKDQLLVYEDFSPLRMLCPSCKKLATHLIPQCPLLSYAPKKLSVIQKYQHRNQQKREIFTRNIIRIKTNTLNSKETVCKNQGIFIQNNETLFMSPKNKGRRGGVFDMQGFLNLSPLRKSKSLPYYGENFEISEEDEEETSPQDRSYKKTYSFDSSKDSPLPYRVDESFKIINKLRNDNSKVQDPTTSLITLSKSSNPIIQEQIDRLIVNRGLPKPKTPPFHKPILKKGVSTREAGEKTEKISSNLQKSMKSSQSVKRRQPFREKTFENLRTPREHDASPLLGKGSKMNSSKKPTFSPLHFADACQRASSSESEASSSNNNGEKPLVFDKVKNFTAYNPQNNIETQILEQKYRAPSPKKNRRRAEILMKFKKVVNTVKISQRMSGEHDFRRKNDSLLRSLKNFYSEDPGSPEFKAKQSPIQKPYLSILDRNITEVLKLKKVPMEKSETKEEIQQKIGLANIIEDENEINSYDKGSLLLN